jgi:transcriptional regulator with XRE-family HTH domain
MSTLGKTIAQARKAKRLSQKELAALITKEDGSSISPQFVNDIERDRRAPSEFVIGKLAAELDLDPDHLCLLTGVLPNDLVGPIAAAPPEIVTTAFRTFRRKINPR